MILYFDPKERYIIKNDASFKNKLWVSRKELL